jgi:alkylation response protein AidB-like acyl-CoA dehydrogenase
LANFFKDNPDLRRRIATAPWAAIVPALERDFTDPDELAPTSVEEAVEQIEMVLDLVGEMAAKEIHPHAAEVDRVGARLVDGKVIYPEPMQRGLELLSEAGLLGFSLPRVHGGMNLPITAYTAAVEIVARADASVMTVFALQGLGETIQRFATKEVQARYLPPLCAGEITPCMALTEPNAGSALGACTTRAVQGANGAWRIRGSKIFITNGGSDILLTLARSEEDAPGGAGLSLFLVERGEGVEVAKLEEKLGIHGSPTALINFDDAPGILIGQRGDGLYKVTLGMLHNVRLEVAAQAIGIAQAAQVEAARYAQERRQFGRAIDQFAPVRSMLFHNALQIEVARALIMTTAAVVDRKRGLERAGGGDEHERHERIADLLTPLSKYYACEMVNRVTTRALQVHGGYGYVREYPVERHLRDGRITNIYEGTSEIQVGALIEPLLDGGLPMLLEEPLRDAQEPAGCSDVLGILRANYETLLQAADVVDEADKLAQQGWARDFADATVDLVAALVFLRDAGREERAAVLARCLARQGRRHAELVLRTVTDGDRTSFQDESFEAIVGPYR